MAAVSVEREEEELSDWKPHSIGSSARARVSPARTTSASASLGCLSLATHTSSMSDQAEMPTRLDILKQAFGEHAQAFNDNLDDGQFPSSAQPTLSPG